MGQTGFYCLNLPSTYYKNFTLVRAEIQHTHSFISDIFWKKPQNRQSLNFNTLHGLRQAENMYFHCLTSKNNLSEFFVNKLIAQSRGDLPFLAIFELSM